MAREEWSQYSRRVRASSHKIDMTVITIFASVGTLPLLMTSPGSLFHWFTLYNSRVRVPLKVAVPCPPQFHGVAALQFIGVSVGQVRESPRHYLPWSSPFRIREKRKKKKALRCVPRSPTGTQTEGAMELANPCKWGQLLAVINGRTPRTERGSSRTSSSRVQPRSSRRFLFFP